MCQGSSSYTYDVPIIHTQVLGRMIIEAAGNPVGLGLSVGGYWRASRRALNPAFSSFKIKQVWHENSAYIYLLLSKFIHCMLSEISYNLFAERIDMKELFSCESHLA